jgi:hypothetical protein
VRVRVRVADGSADESRSLATWLRDEPQVRAFGQPETAGNGGTDGGTGEMGTGMEVLTLLLGTGLSAAQLVLSIIMWRATRDEPVRVVIVRDDREVAVETSDPDEAAAIATRLEAN